MAIRYSLSEKIDVGQFIDILRRSTLSERRPVDNTDKMQKMVDNGNIIATAWDDAKLVGIARSITDFAFCCYLSDLAVDAEYQRQGIGKQLIEITRKQIDDDIPLFLFAAPKAETYYPKVGFQSKTAWIIH